MYALLIVALVYSGLWIVGVSGNIWVMTKVIATLVPCASSRGGGGGVGGARHRLAVQSSARCYLLMLTLIDLTSLVCTPFLAVDIAINHWPFTPALCTLFFACEGASKSVTPFVLTALSVDRWLAVCAPSAVCLRRAPFAIGVLVVCVCIASPFIVYVALVANVSTMTDATDRPHRKCALSTISRTFDTLHMLVCYLVPLLTICAVYAAILRRLYLHTRVSSLRRQTSISLSRVLKFSAAVVVFYFGTWTPYWALRFFVLVAGGMRRPFSCSADRVFVGPSGKTADNFVALMYILHALPYTQRYNNSRACERSLQTRKILVRSTGFFMQISIEICATPPRRPPRRAVRLASTRRRRTRRRTVAMAALAAAAARSRCCGARSFGVLAAAASAAAAAAGRVRTDLVAVAERRRGRRAANEAPRAARPARCLIQASKRSTLKSDATSRQFDRRSAHCRRRARAYRPTSVVDGDDERRARSCASPLHSTKRRRRRRRRRLAHLERSDAFASLEILALCARRVACA